MGFLSDPALRALLLSLLDEEIVTAGGCNCVVLCYVPVVVKIVSLLLVLLSCRDSYTAVS